MEKYEEEFLVRIHQLMAAGLDFEATVREALLETVGETPSGVLLNWLSAGSLQNPGSFVKDISRFFGQGAVSILNSIVVVAESLVIQPPVQQAENPMSSLVVSIIASAEGSSQEESIPAKKAVYLHDHRIRDEWDERQCEPKQNEEAAGDNSEEQTDAPSISPSCEESLVV